jgi:hypothetical protein
MVVNEGKSSKVVARVWRGDVMERLDHFVVHIDEDREKLASLKDQIVPMGFPFNPTSGKRTKGFQVANIWIGEQYFELVWLKTSDGGGWRKEWVEKYNRGLRGIFGLCIMTDRLDALEREMRRRGVDVSAPERITFKALFGLLKKTLPFRCVYTPPIPGTDLQIFFLEMDSLQKYEFMKKYYMRPNAEQNGITGIREAIVRCRFSGEAWDYIRALFPSLSGDERMATYDMGHTKLHFLQTDHVDLRVELQAATTNEDLATGSFEIENVRVIISPINDTLKLEK